MDEPFDYPPADHVLRDLPFELHVTGSATAATLRAAPELCGPSGLLLGPLATVVDLIGGSMAAAAVAPDWVATAQMSLHLGRVVAEGDVVRATGRVLRAGRNNVVVGVAVEDDLGPLGDAVLGFSRLPRRATTPDLSTIRPPEGPRDFPRDPALAPQGTWREVLGASTGEGCVEAPVGTRVRNSFGAMNGGVVASLAELAALDAAGAAGVVEPSASDLVVHYLAQGRGGPVVATAAPLAGRLGDPARLGVDVRDASDGRAMVRAHVVVAAGTPARPDRRHT